MAIGSLLKQLAFEAGKGLVTGLIGLVRGKPKPEPEVRGLSHADVEYQQRMIDAATSHKVPHKVPPRPKD
jgi:hypothetical protein